MQEQVRVIQYNDSMVIRYFAKVAEFDEGYEVRFKGRSSDCKCKRGGRQHRLRGKKSGIVKQQRLVCVHEGQPFFSFLMHMSHMTPYATCFAPCVKPIRAVSGLKVDSCMSFFRLMIQKQEN